MTSSVPPEVASDQAPLPDAIKDNLEISLIKKDEFYDANVLIAAQGMRAYGPSDKEPEGRLALASGYLNGADMYTLAFESIFRTPIFYPSSGSKTLLADVARLQNSDYAYTDYHAHRIILMSDKGEQKAIWDEGLDLKNPIGIDQFPDGRILVVDYGNDALKVLSSDGKLLRTIRTLNNEPMNAPYDVRITSDKIIFVDRGDHKINILDHEFNVLRVMVGSSQGGYGFDHPSHIDIDSRNYLYVMDSNTKSIKVIDMQDYSLKARLVHPSINIMRGLAIDGEDRIYISGFKTGFPEPPTKLKEEHAGIIVFERVDFSDTQ